MMALSGVRCCKLRVPPSRRPLTSMRPLRCACCAADRHSDPCITQEGEAILARRDVQVGWGLRRHSLRAAAGRTQVEARPACMPWPVRSGPQHGACGPVGLPAWRQDALHANLTGQLKWPYKGCTEGEVFKVWRHPGIAVLVGASAGSLQALAARGQGGMVVHQHRPVCRASPLHRPPGACCTCCPRRACCACCSTAWMTSWKACCRCAR